MKKYILLFLTLSACLTYIYSQELRGTWLARDSFTSKEILAQAIDSIAAANFNTIYVNVWSRGYPLWRSEVFFKETGIRIDPAYAERDILAEAIAEGHKRGLHVEAWFEYGFVGGWTGNLPAGEKGHIFKKHPDWVARKNDGTEKDGSNFYWMIHTKPEVQQFLIDLCLEVAEKYDIDGIELDRIRYSSLSYGYDNYTDSLYRAENNNNPLPTNTSDSKWIRWRADKLNIFMKNAYDQIKAKSSHVNISNAPSLYGSSYTSYDSFCQDWFWWVNNNAIDNVQVQSYVSSPNSFGNILAYLSSNINDKTKAYPALAISPNGNDIPLGTLAEFFNVSRTRGFQGNAVWYFGDMKSRNLFSWFRNGVYKEPAHPPYSKADWRAYSKIITVNDTSNARKSGKWDGSNLYGYNGPSFKASADTESYIDYYTEIPADGNYELYAYIVAAVDRSTEARYQIYPSENNDETVIVNQSNLNNRRWYKLGDYYFTKGRKRVIRLTNEGLHSGKFVSADAVLISLNRRLSPDVTTNISDMKSDNKMYMNFNLRNFPNPFNNDTKISFYLNDLKPYNLGIYNLLGEKVFSTNERTGKLGENVISFSPGELSSGIYICSLIQDYKQESIKLVLTK